METQNQYLPNGGFSLRNRLSNLLLYLRANWLKSFLITLVLVLILSVIVLIISPEPTEQQPIPLVPVTSGVVEPPTNVNVIFQSIPENIPDQLPVYQAISQANNALEVAELIAAQLNIPNDPSPHLENVWTNYESREQITFQPSSDKITYNSLDRETNDTNLNSPFNNAQAIEAGEQFLLKLNLPKLQPDMSKATYIYEEHETETGSQAKSVKIPFNLEINGYPLFYSGSTNAFATATIDKDYRVVKVEFFPQIPEYQLLETKTVKSQETLAEEIENGQAIVLSSGNDFSEYDTSQLEQLTVLNTSLEYRFSPENHLITPYFRLEARGLSESLSAPLELVLILPAIPTTNPASPSQ